MAYATWVCGGQRREFFLISGEFTTTMKDSELGSSFGGLYSNTTDITGDDVNWAGIDRTTDYVVWASGHMTTTVKSSIYIGTWRANPHGLTCDETDTGTSGISWLKTTKWSGKMTTTIKTSLTNWGFGVPGTSWDLDDNTMICKQDGTYTALASGQFTTTIKASIDLSGRTDSIGGCSNSDNNLITAGEQVAVPEDELIKWSGIFTSTVKASLSFKIEDQNPRGIEAYDFDVRMNGVSEGYGAFDLPLLVVQSGTGATGNVILPLYDTEFSSSSVYAWSDGDIILPLIDADNDVLSNYAFGDGTLPILVLVVTRPDLAITMVMNTKTFAMSEYAGYEFNSYTIFNGVAVLGGREGIFEADNTDLDGTNGFTILSRATTGEIDVHSDNRANRLRNAFVNYESDGGVRLSTQADGSVDRAYPIETSGEDGILERRVKFERGIKNRIFKFKIENISGAKLELESLTVTLEPIQSRRG